MDLHLHWRCPRNRKEVLTLQDLKSQQERTLGSQPVHLVIFTCKDTSASGSVDYRSKMLNFELYVMNIDELAIFHSNVIYLGSGFLKGEIAVYLK